jgi:colanic acid/amylovoran biosynthesis glycosyltransferase
MAESFPRLACITSMAKGGLTGFNYHELRELRRLGVPLLVFVTKHVPGPYGVPDGIRLCRVLKIRTLLLQPFLLLARPILYVRLLREALGTRTVRDFLIAGAWSREMRRHRTDRIHCHWGDHKLFIGYYCHRLLRVPLSVTVHGYELYANPNRAMFERCLDACDRVVTISDHTREHLCGRFPRHREKIVVVRLFAGTEGGWETREDGLRILIVGGFMPRKGYAALLEALRILDRDDVHLWIAGYGGPIDVPDLVRRFGLRERVTIFGHASDDVLKVLYRACDLFCLPSCFGPDGIGEGLPVALMEAMSFGKPVIATRHTGIPELVEEVLVPEHDAQALAGAIRALIGDPERRRAMGRRNREIVRERYGRENVGRLLQVLAGGSEA